jgi:flagellar protein FlaG
MKVPPASSPAAREEQLAHQRQLVSAGPELKSRQETIRGKTPAVTTAASAQDLENALEQINRTSEAMNIGLRFKLHDKTDRVMVEVIDVEKNEVLKEIPPEKILNMVAQIQDMIGLMLDAKR